MTDEVSPEVTGPIHKLLNEYEILKIKEAFERANGRKLNRDQLREVLKKSNVEFDDEHYDIIFKKINFACNGTVTWGEFISHLILGFEQAEVSVEFKTLDSPIQCAPLIVKTTHRHTIKRITFCPTVKLDRSTTWNDGSIITCSSDGTINYWSLDLQLERSVQSKCPYLNIHSTNVTDLAVFPDFSIICTSSTERDLRFYDTSARKFELRVMIVSLPSAVCTMYYTFDKDVTVPSKLVVGDIAGNVRVFLIAGEDKGPFRAQPGTPQRISSYEGAVKGSIPGIKVIEINGVHTDLVKEVYYYSNLHSVVSCSSCKHKAFQISDIWDLNKAYPFDIHGGVWSFAVTEEKHIIATGGPDCLVRLWSPFIITRAICTFYGHHTAIVRMLFQDNGEKLYSLSKDKCIKVWDVAAQQLIQTFLELPPNLGDDLTTLYNPESRQWIIGSVFIVIISLYPKQSSEHTDGSTHRSGVSVLLYNNLFKCIVTCGLDSYIIVWDPWDGRRLLVIKEAHICVALGQVFPIEITCATFDPGLQRLVTGCHDGTLKIWNFNTGTCLRNLRISHVWCEVRSVIWVKGRILAIGWNRRVIEFADTNDTDAPGGAFIKNWDLRHAEDVSMAVVKVPDTVATGSYAGELILWRLETGQPYKKFNVSNPKARLKLFYQATSKQRQTDDQDMATKPRSASVGADLNSPLMPRGHRVQRVSSLIMPIEVLALKKLAIHSMLFLNARKSENVETGTLLIGLENGIIQVWNHTDAGGFITSFSAIHKAGDYVISMTTDENNDFVFVGTTVGYIKTWLLKNYCIPKENMEHICMPALRLRFPFMWGDRILGRAQRMTKNQPKPVLLNSYKGHFMPVSGLVYIDKSEILISSSADFSCRMWTLGGRYFQTLGTFKPWKCISGKAPNDDVTRKYSIPPDIKRVASSTTLRVLMGGSFPKRLTIKQLKKIQEQEMVAVDLSKIYGTALTHPVLGHHYTLPERTTTPKEVQFDTSCFYVPIYQHLITPPPMGIVKNRQHSTENSK